MRWIAVQGPLAAFVDGLRRELAGKGYSSDTIRDHVHLLADLSGGLGSQGMDAADLTEAVAEEFLDSRRAAGRRIGTTGRALAPTLEYLRGLRVAPPSGPRAPESLSWQEVVLAAYRRHLAGERGLAMGTIKHYLRCAQRFLGWLPDSAISLSELSAAQVTRFVLVWARCREGLPPDLVMLPALRCFLRFLHTAGHIPHALSGAVPSGRAHPGRFGLPRAVSADAIRAVLATCDRECAVGRRDYAIIVSLTRLALRSGAVAHLESLISVGRPGR